MDIEDVRHRARIYLRANGVTQKVMADDIGYSDAMVSLWLRSKSSSPFVASRIDAWLQDRASLQPLKAMAKTAVIKQAQDAAALMNANDLPATNMNEKIIIDSMKKLALSDRAHVKEIVLNDARRDFDEIEKEVEREDIGSSTGERRFAIYPGDTSQISSNIPFTDRIAQVRAHEIHQSLFKAPYSKVDLVYNGNGVVEMVGSPKWAIMNKFDENSMIYYKNRGKLMKEYLGEWVCINSDGTVMIFPTSASARHGRKDDDSFICCVGMEEQAVLVYSEAVLLLSFEIPPPIEELPDYLDHKTQFIGSRRWLTLPMKDLKGNTKCLHFLLDTGSPISFLLEPRLFGTVKSGRTADFCSLKIFGIDLECQPSANSSNPAVHNINLLGTDFLDEFLVIDERRTKTLILLRRPPARGTTIVMQ